MDKDIIRDYELDIIVRAWRDERFRLSLLDDAKRSIEEEFHITIPEEMNIFVHVEDDNNLHLIVPALPSNFAASDLSDDELKDVIGGVLAENHQSLFSNGIDKNRIKTLTDENQAQKQRIAVLEKEINGLKQSLSKK